MSNDPRITVKAGRGRVPAKRINKPSVGMDDEIAVIYPDPATLKAVSDQVSRREFCGRMDGFDCAEDVRTDRKYRLVSLLEADMLAQWLRSRPGGWDGKVGDLRKFLSDG